MGVQNCIVEKTCQAIHLKDMDVFFSFCGQGERERFCFSVDIRKVKAHLSFFYLCHTNFTQRRTLGKLNDR